MAETAQTPSMPRSSGATHPNRRVAPQSEDDIHNPLADGNELGAEMVAAMRDSATALFEEQRDRAANEIKALGDVLQHSAQSLAEQGGVVARCADEAGSQINEFADRLRRRSWGELTGDIENFARRYPMAFIGTAAGLGFIAARLLAAPADAQIGQTPTQSSMTRRRGLSEKTRSAIHAAGNG